MKIQLLDMSKAELFGLPPFDTDTDAILKDYATRGWTDADTMRHIQTAIDAGAFQMIYPTRTEKVTRVEKEH